MRHQPMRAKSRKASLWRSSATTRRAISLPTPFGWRADFRINASPSAATAKYRRPPRHAPALIAANDRRLKRVLPEEGVPEPDLWLLMRRDLAKLARIRAVADYLIELFQSERKYFPA